MIIHPIGYLQTCFKEKFGIPRQSLLVKEAKGILKLNPDPFFHQALKGIEGFDHLWVIFIFHQQPAKHPQKIKPSIRPPRLGGMQKIGVFASRSPHRPNPLGLSVVRLEKIDYQAKGGIELFLEGVDILDGTPVVDIKPYLPYADSFPSASAGWAAEPLTRLPVLFSTQALDDLEHWGQPNYPQLKELIKGMLELDPRPAFQKRKPESQVYGIRLLEFDVKWTFQNESILVLEIIKIFPTLPTLS